MAKAKAKSWPDAPPYLAAAFLCERVLVEGDKVPSYMRVVDQLTLPRPVDDIPHGAVVALNYTLVISFRPGDFRGKLPLKVQRVGPSGERVMLIEHSMEFQSALPEAGNTLGIGLHMKWDGEGLYWFDVVLDGKLRTRIPVRVALAKPSLDSAAKTTRRKTAI